MSVLQRRGILTYKGYRYLRLAAVLMAAAVAAYLWVPVSGEHYGGTWLGYALGIVSGLMVLWMMGYGAAKRRPPAPAGKRRSAAQSAGVRTGGRQQGRLSAHVYFGTALIVLATLHTGFEFGWNVHTLSYALMALTVAGGYYGVYAYRHYPQLMTLNEGGLPLDEFLAKLAELDEQARLLALDLPDEINELVVAAITGTHVGGNLFRQLQGYRRGCPTTKAVKRLQEIGPKYIYGDQPRIVRELYAVMLSKEKMVLQARRRIMQQARVQFWLYFHMPLAVAFFAALVAHVVSILFYW